VNSAATETQQKVVKFVQELLLDEEDTGLLCPTKMLPTTAGKHLVGIFVPRERRTLSVETTVEIGSKPAVVTFSE